MSNFLCVRRYPFNHKGVANLFSVFHKDQARVLKSFTKVLTYIAKISSDCIPVCGQIKKAARVDNLVIPQCTGCRQWLRDANVKYEDSQLENT